MKYVQHRTLSPSSYRAWRFKQNPEWFLVEPVLVGTRPVVNDLRDRQAIKQLFVADENQRIEMHHTCQLNV